MAFPAVSTAVLSMDGRALKKSAALSTFQGSEISGQILDFENPRRSNGVER
jgi:hypothetical protein